MSTGSLRVRSSCSVIVAIRLEVVPRPPSYLHVSRGLLQETSFQQLLSGQRGGLRFIRRPAAWTLCQVILGLHMDDITTRPH
ncbi:hypothetical protein EYF80_040944 [Liparis tanakae]|uniref:Uncharacterized protein n=1 Tax=Liparis tanakae TaxID=230148 RepID=A0A4Z2G5M1_9TELE|nr:hypothetical protein EYF80_040944 [Liparis tanakae]